LDESQQHRLRDTELLPPVDEEVSAGRTKPGGVTALERKQPSPTVRQRPLLSANRSGLGACGWLAADPVS